MARAQAPRRPPLPAGAAWLLAALLLLAQGLGLVHGIAHGVAHGMAHGVPQAPAHAAAGLPAHGVAAAAPVCEEAGHGHAHAAAPADGWAAAHAHGGAHEAGDAQCRLIDQLAHADGLWAADAAPVLPPARSAAPATALRLALAGGGSAAYLARA
ncbi:hypothetical protein IP87_02760, partial [beta proteobacterium AAP121]